jgi:Protein of unknown function (DUF3775)
MRRRDFGACAVVEGSALMPRNEPQSEGQTDLAISLRQVCFVIFKAREFGAKDEVTEPDPASNPIDDHDLAVLEDHGDDPVVEELTSLIDFLNVDEQIDLVALAWLGRDDNSAEDWPEIRQQAFEAHNRNTARYLLGMPLLSDYLEQGLSLLGYSCAELEFGRL